MRTYIVNDTKKECTLLHQLPMTTLDKIWDLRYDHIYIFYTNVQLSGHKHIDPK